MLGISRFNVFIFVMCTFCLVFCRDASAELLTPEAYLDYLTEQGKANPEALKAKGQFIKMSSEKKQKFMKYINDPQVVASVFKEMVALQQERKELFGGDVIIENHEYTTEKELYEEASPSILHRLLSSIFINEVAAAPIYKGMFSRTYRKC